MARSSKLETKARPGRSSEGALSALVGLEPAVAESVGEVCGKTAVCAGLGYYLDSHALVSLFAETKATTVEEAVERLMKAGGPQASRRELKEDISNRLMQNKRSRSASRSASGSRKKSKKSKKDRKKQKSKKKHKKGSERKNAGASGDRPRGALPLCPQSAIAHFFRFFESRQRGDAF